MKQISLLLLIFIIVFPSFSSIRKEINPDKNKSSIIKKISGMIETLQRDNTIDPETKRSFNSLLTSLKTQNIIQTNTIIARLKSSLAEKTNSNIAQQNHDISKLSVINSDLKTRINYLNGRVSEVLNKKGKNNFEIEFKDYNSSLQFIEEINKPKIATEIEQKENKPLVNSLLSTVTKPGRKAFKNKNEFKTRLANRINLLSKSADKSQLKMLALQKSMNKQAQLMQTIHNMLKMIESRKNTLIQKKR